MNRASLFISVAISLLIVNGIATAQPFITKDSVVKAGIYTTFNEFRSGQPSFALNTAVKTGNYPDIGIDKMRRYPNFKFYYLMVSKERKRQIGSVYAFSDGKQMYLKPQKAELTKRTKFYKLDCQNEYCFFQFLTYVRHDPITGPPMPNHTNRAYGILNLKTSIITYVTPKRLKKIIADDIALAMEYAMEKDKKDQIKPYFFRYIAAHQSSSYLDNITSSNNINRIIIYRKSSGESKTPVRFMAYDKMNTSFAPDSYLELRNDLGRDSIAICYGENMETCIRLPIDPDHTTYIECSLKKKENNPSFTKVRTSKGEFDSVKPKRVHQSRAEAKKKEEIRPY